MHFQEDIVKNLTVEESSYKCYLCKDTGYIFNKLNCSVVKCKCLIERQRAILPSLYANKTFDDMNLEGYRNKQQIKALINYIENANPMEVKKGLYIQGDVGRGKTLLASCIFNHFVNFMNVKFIKVEELIAKARDMFSDETIDLDKYKEADILILDDLGVEKVTEYAEDVLYALIDYRYVRQMPIFITSNIPASKLLELYPKHGKRIESRLIGDKAMCEVMTLDGVDYRK